VADPNHMRQVYERYPELLTKGDVDAIVDFYAEDATIEDPIGSDLHAGREAIRAFYAAAAGTVIMKRSGPICVADDEAATTLVVLMGPEGNQSALDIISSMTFDDAGRVKTMRAVWRMEDVRPATADD